LEQRLLVEGLAKGAQSGRVADGRRKRREIFRVQRGILALRIEKVRDGLAAHAREHFVVRALAVDRIGDSRADLERVLDDLGPCAFFSFPC
jgi:hypothetical protein